MNLDHSIELLREAAQLKAVQMRELGDHREDLTRERRVELCREQQRDYLDAIAALMDRQRSRP